MDNELLLRLIGDAPLIAFLLYAWNSERKERIKTQETLVSVLMEHDVNSVKSA
jgi:hypothetical protein